jgi:uncharacterized protein YbjT (DUF2867 family)
VDKHSQFAVDWAEERRVRVLITGGTGLIGAAVVARLLAEGHAVTGIARNVSRAARRLPQVNWISFNIAAATSPDAWLPVLAEVEAVVNCAGALQDGLGESVKGVHAEGAAAMFAACGRAGVRRVVHFSAIGVDRETPSPFSETKRQGDEVLMKSGLDWVILRPSVVVGRSAYGGSALFRGLAALPVLPVMPRTGPLQIVQLDQVVDTVLFFLRPGAPSRVALELAGPERLSFADVVRHYRRWFGWKDAARIPLPCWAANLLYKLGDFAGSLGWRPPMRTTAQREITRGAVGDPDKWTRLTGIVPRPLSAELAATPPSVQERWFAGLYILKPVIFTIFSLFWILTGIISLTSGYVIGVNLMLEGGAGPLAAASVVAGALADILIGIAIAIRRTSRLGLYAALAITVFYIVAGTLLVPRLWADPLGPMLKIWPILAFNLAALAILEDR